MQMNFEDVTPPRWAESFTFFLKEASKIVFNALNTSVKKKKSGIENTDSV